MNGDIVDKIIQFESEGFETDEELVSFFQELIDSDLVWKLQGVYGRMAQNLIDQGYCSMPKQGSEQEE